MWLVTIQKKVAKNLRNRKKIPIEVENAMIALIAELRQGPVVNWPNYSKLKKRARTMT
jgi:hypothetical protein